MEVQVHSTKKASSKAESPTVSTKERLPNGHINETTFPGWWFEMNYEFNAMPINIRVLTIWPKVISFPQLTTRQHASTTKLQRKRCSTTLYKYNDEIITQNNGTNQSKGWNKQCKPIFNKMREMGDRQRRRETKEVIEYEGQLPLQFKAAIQQKQKAHNHK